MGLKFLYESTHRSLDGLKLFFVLVMLLVGKDLFAQEAIISDAKHYSQVFGESRNYRIFLPPDYAGESKEKYPVVYFYHGWSERYFGNLEINPDETADNEKKIAELVAKHSIIVVKPDGYNANPEEPYKLRPYNIGPVETYRQFSLYFPELVQYIDGKYPTLADRQHRAISGFSMGGFMTYWIAGKYPHLLSAAGAFCASPEFVIGPKDFPVEYFHEDMWGNYEGLRLRLNYGNKDFIRAYHKDINEVWLQVKDNYTYQIYDAAHEVCGLEDMFLFFEEAFKDPLETPEQWNHVDVYPDFSVWGYQIRSDRDVPGFTVLENVDKNGFRSSVRVFLPDGELLPMVNLTILTDSLYERNGEYLINAFNLTTKENFQRKITADEKGRLKIDLDGGLYEVGISGLDRKPHISIAAVKLQDENYAIRRKNMAISVELLNKGTAEAQGVQATLSPFRKSAAILADKSDFGTMAMNEIKEGESHFEFHVSSDSIAIERFNLMITDKDGNQWEQHFTIPLKGGHELVNDVEIADGRRLTYAVHGTDSVTGKLGEGNGDGIPNPGESIVVLVKDKGKLWPASLFGTDKDLDFNGEHTRISDNWANFDHVGGSFKYNVPVISAETAAEKTIDLFAEYWLPDYPDHIIKNGKISITVSGSDKTAPQLSWVKLAGDNVLRARIFDGAETVEVSVTLKSKENPESVVQIELNDKGQEGDRIPNDGVFSKKIEGSPFGVYQAEIKVRDQLGNERTIEVPEPILLHEATLYHE